MERQAIHAESTHEGLNCLTKDNPADMRRSSLPRSFLDDAEFAQFAA